MTTSEYGKAFEDGFSKTVCFLVSRGVSPEAAEEAAQAGWTRGWSRRHQLRDPNCVLTWINSVAMNLFRSTRRSAKMMQILTEMPASNTAMLADLDVRGILSRCGPIDRSILKLYYLDGYTTGEIGHRMGLSSTAVRVRMFRARRRLGSHLQIQRTARGGKPTVHAGRVGSQFFYAPQKAA